MKTKIIFMFLLCIFIVGLSGCAGCGRGYSDGDRVGIITKFSHKGFVFKSWEGQLNLGGTVSAGDKGVVPSTWEFSVRDEKLVPLIQSAMSSGKRVKCHYLQWVVSPTTMDSGYEIVGVEIVE